MDREVVLIENLVSRIAEELYTVYDYSRLSRMLYNTEGRVLADILRRDVNNEIRHMKTLMDLVESRGYPIPSLDRARPVCVMDWKRFEKWGDDMTVAINYRALLAELILAELCAVSAYLELQNVARMYGDDEEIVNIAQGIAMDEREHLFLFARLGGEEVNRVVRSLLNWVMRNRGNVNPIEVLQKAGEEVRRVLGVS